MFSKQSQMGKLGFFCTATQLHTSTNVQAHPQGGGHPHSTHQHAATGSKGEGKEREGPKVSGGNCSPAGLRHFLGESILLATLRGHPAPPTILATSVIHVLNTDS